MVFNSYIFILLFLPLCLLGYFSLNRFQYYRVGLVFLTGMSLWFYGYFNPSYLPIICGSVIVNYGLYRLMQRMAHEEGLERRRKWAFWGGLAFNLGLLGYFKYADFFLRNVNVLFQTDYPMLKILLPLGISFFTFQQISFIADIYGDKEGKISYSFLAYAAYVTYFPQLVAGPIVTHDVLVPQLQDVNRKRVDFDYLSKGIALFVLGLAKKVLIADILGNYVNLAYADVKALNGTTAVLAVLGYTLQIYFDFSGYSDMAIGLGWMMNIDLPVNFNSPYKATSVTEFWKRWHMTLTAFFTKYVYIPLGGNRKGTARTYANIFIVFLLSGFWHGAGWHFVLWGGIHGLAQMTERLLGRRDQSKILMWKTKETGRFAVAWGKIKLVLGWVWTFSFVNIAWVFFRANSMAEVRAILSKLWHFQFGAISQPLANVFAQPEWSLLWSANPRTNLKFYFVLGLVLAIALPSAKQLAEQYVSRKWSAFVVAFLLVWCIFSFTGISTFLYFNF